MLLAWFAGVIALVGILIFIGFVAFSPTLMNWVEEHPGAIQHGVVRDFVEWYRPGALADDPVGEDGQRIAVTVDLGTNDSEIGKLLFDKGLVRSELAFQYAVYLAGREGTLQAGTYDLSPSMRPSQIVGALRQEAGQEIEIRIQEGWRLEEIVGYLGTTQADDGPGGLCREGAGAPRRPGRSLRLPRRSPAGPVPGRLPVPRYLPRRCRTPRPTK